MTIEGNLAGRRILVVEDDYLVALDLCEDLRKHGATVLGPAPTSHYAGLLLLGRGVDGAVLDIRLHGGTVFEFARMLRRRRVPFVFTTGATKEAVPEEFRDTPWLQKPVRSELLVRSIASELAGAAEHVAPPADEAPGRPEPRHVSPANASAQERWYRTVATALARSHHRS